MSDRRFPLFPDIYLPQLRDVSLPALHHVELIHHHTAGLAEPEQLVRSELERSQRLCALKPGASVAIAVGSRGIGGLPAVVTAAVGWLHGRKLKPFIVPAMGSHGGADADTQRGILHAMGIDPQRMGAPIVSSMAVTQLGETADGIPCRFSSDALAADAVLVINRVKSHTSFDRPVESGLTKMVAVGLGKAEGARFVHRLGPTGLRDVLPELARIAIAAAPIAFGLALVENAHKQLIQVEGVEPQHFERTDTRLLAVARRHLARLPFEQIDVLVVEEIGKDISGMGMDYAVIGRTDIRGIPNPPRPFIHKIVVLSLTAASHGNAQGIGVADFITRRVVESVDLVDMYTNSVTAAVIEKARIPPVLPNDAEAIKAAIATSWRLHEHEVRLCIIGSTLHLNHILVSPALAAELAGSSSATVDPTAIAMRFSQAGRLQTRCRRAPDSRVPEVEP